MRDYETLQAFDQLKVLSDPRRLHLLRLLMAQPASLTGLGQQIGRHPAWVRHHLKRLEQAGLVESVAAGALDKVYRPSAQAYVIQALVLPEARSGSALVFSGSHDLAVEMLGEEVAGVADLLTLSNGSLDGLVMLRQGLSHLAGCHLFDPDLGEYNRSYVGHLFPDRSMTLVNLADRVQGLMVPAGNPRQVRSLADLGGGELRFVNRNRGSGTRLWLDAALRQIGVAAESIRGYAVEARTHTQVAASVRDDLADVGIGLLAAARRFGLGFLPLFQERYQLVIPTENLGQRQFEILLNHLHSAAFRRHMTQLGGYDAAHTGEQLIVH